MGSAIRSALLLLVAVCLAACDMAIRPPQATPTPASDRPAAQIDVANPQDRLTAAWDGDQLVVDVESPTGVGRADVDLAGDAPPRVVVLRFHLQGLEGLEFTYGDTVVTASLLGTGDHDVLEQVVRPGMAAPEQVGPDSAYWMDVQIVGADAAGPVTIPLADGEIEVMAPADFLQGGHQAFSIAWIDFYR